MITGFNTDVDFDGRVFHVQTEDKGRENPTIESLVYSRGEIVAARNTRYEDLNESSDYSGRFGDGSYGATASASDPRDP